MPTDLPAKTGTTRAARRAKALQKRLSEVEEQLAALSCERTAITRELAGLWVDVDMPTRARSGQPASGTGETAEESNHGKPGKTGGEGGPGGGGKRDSASAKKKR